MTAIHESLRHQCELDEVRIKRVLDLDIDSLQAPRNDLEEIMTYPVQTNCVSGQYVGKESIMMMNLKLEQELNKGLITKLVTRWLLSVG